MTEDLTHEDLIEKRRWNTAIQHVGHVYTGTFLKTR